MTKLSVAIAALVGIIAFGATFQFQIVEVEPSKGTPFKTFRVVPFWQDASKFELSENGSYSMSVFYYYGLSEDPRGFGGGRGSAH